MPSMIELRLPTTQELAHKAYARKSYRYTVMLTAMNRMWPRGLGYVPPVKLYSCPTLWTHTNRVVSQVCADATMRFAESNDLWEQYRAWRDRPMKSTKNR